MRYDEALDISTDINYIIDNSKFLFDFYKKTHEYPDSYGIPKTDIRLYCYYDYSGSAVITIDEDRDEIIFINIERSDDVDMDIITILPHGASNFGWHNDSTKNLGHVRTTSEEEYFMNSTLYDHQTVLYSVIMSNIRNDICCSVRHIDANVEHIKRVVTFIKGLKNE